MFFTYSGRNVKLTENNLSFEVGMVYHLFEPGSWLNSELRRIVVKRFAPSTSSQKLKHLNLSDKTNHNSERNKNRWHALAN
jgi:hypothetical protein